MEILLGEGLEKIGGGNKIIFDNSECDDLYSMIFDKDEIDWSKKMKTAYEIHKNV